MKYLLTPLFLIHTIFVIAQKPNNYISDLSRRTVKALKVDSTLTIPFGNNPSLRLGGTNQPGALYFKTTDSSLYSWTGYQWNTVGRNLDTTSLSNRIDLKLDTAYLSSAGDSLITIKNGHITATAVAIIDTSSISNRINTKADTSNVWLLDGNTGTSPSAHFIGTADNKDLVFKANGEEGMRVVPNDNGGVTITSSGVFGKKLRIRRTLSNIAWNGNAYGDMEITSTYGDGAIGSSGININVLGNPTYCHLGSWKSPKYGLGIYLEGLTGTYNHSSALSLSAVSNKTLSLWKKGNSGNIEIRRFTESNNFSSDIDFIRQKITLANLNPWNREPPAVGDKISDLSFRDLESLSGNIQFHVDGTYINPSNGQTYVNSYDYRIVSCGNIIYKIQGNGNTYIGYTTNPIDEGYKLDINGTLRTKEAITIEDGTEGAGKVLTSDSDGKASWQTVSATITNGEFTPTVTGATNITLAPVINSHHYYVIGDYVHVTGHFGFTASNGSTAAFYLSVPYLQPLPNQILNSGVATYYEETTNDLKPGIIRGWNQDWVECIVGTVNTSNPGFIKYKYSYKIFTP